MAKQGKRTIYIDQETWALWEQGASVANVSISRLLRDIADFYAVADQIRRYQDRREAEAKRLFEDKP